MRTALRKMGNSAGMIVPKAILTELGSEIGEEFEIRAEDGRIVAAPLAQRKARNGNPVAGRLPAEQEAQLAALAGELRAAADRMAARLDGAIAGLRDANDPARDEAFRERARAELCGGPVVLDFTGGGQP